MDEFDREYIAHSRDSVTVKSVRGSVRRGFHLIGDPDTSCEEDDALWEIAPVSPSPASSGQVWEDDDVLSSADSECLMADVPNRVLRKHRAACEVYNVAEHPPDDPEEPLPLARLSNL